MGQWKVNIASILAISIRILSTAFLVTTLTYVLILKALLRLTASSFNVSCFFLRYKLICGWMSYMYYIKTRNLKETAGNTQLTKTLFLKLDMFVVNILYWSKINIFYFLKATENERYRICTCDWNFRKNENITIQRQHSEALFWIYHIGNSQSRLFKNQGRIEAYKLKSCMTKN